MTIDELVNAGFPKENWPEDLPEPGGPNITQSTLEGTKELYRFECTIDGTTYASEVVLDTTTVPNPAEGVGFMLNQFAYLWRTNKGAIEAQPDGSCRRIDF